MTSHAKATALPANLYIGRVQVVEGWFSETGDACEAYMATDDSGYDETNGPSLFLAQALSRYRLEGPDIEGEGLDMVEEALTDWAYETIYVLPVEGKE